MELKTIKLLEALNVPDHTDPEQSARNYAGAVVEVSADFAAQMVEERKAEYFTPDSPAQVAAAPEPASAGSGSAVSFDD